MLDKERRSPLHLAAFRNGWRTMKSLIRLGANVSLKDNDSRNVLHASVIHGGDLEKMLDDEFCVRLFNTEKKYFFQLQMELIPLAFISLLKA